MSRFTPRGASEWGAVAPVWLGILGLLACLVFWMATGRVEPIFVTTFAGLLAVGAGARALDVLRQPPAPPIPPGDHPGPEPVAEGGPAS